MAQQISPEYLEDDYVVISDIEGSTPPTQITELHRSVLIDHEDTEHNSESGGISKSDMELKTLEQTISLIRAGYYSDIEDETDDEDINDSDGNITSDEMFEYVGNDVTNSFQNHFIAEKQDVRLEVHSDVESEVNSDISQNNDTNNNDNENIENELTVEMLQNLSPDECSKNDYIKFDREDQQGEKKCDQYIERIDLLGQITTKSDKEMDTLTDDKDKAKESSECNDVESINADLADEQAAVQILSLTDDKKLQLNEAALEQVLLRNEVRNKNVVVISINGKYRQGKSFLLNFFRYRLENQIGKNSAVINWLQGDEQIDGFKWKCSYKSVTTGMYMWNKPFIVRQANGEEVAVLLIDTQGLFDIAVPPVVNSHIFTLSTLISSHQIINVQKNISDSEFEQLKYVTQYGQFVTEKRHMTPFQNLMFLVRDWTYIDEFKLGLNGGNDYLNDILLTVKSSEPKEFEKIKNLILSCYKKYECYLLPYPGEKVANDANFKGNVADIDELFLNHVQNFIDHLLHPENLQTKAMNGIKLTCSDLVAAFKRIFASMQGDRYLEPKDLFEATAEASYNKVIDGILKTYDQAMAMELIRLLMMIDNKSDETALMQFHQERLSIAEDSFYLECRISNCSDLDAKYLQILLDRLQQQYYKWKCQFWEDVSQHLKDQLQRRRNEMEHAKLENESAQDRSKKCRRILQEKCKQIEEAKEKVLEKLDNPNDKRRVREFIQVKVSEFILAKEKLIQEENQLVEKRELLQKGEGKLEKAVKEVNGIQVTEHEKNGCNNSHDNSSTKSTEEEKKRCTLVKNASQIMNEVDADLLSNQQSINNTEKLIHETKDKSSKFLKKINCILETLCLGLGVLIALCALH